MTGPDLTIATNNGDVGGGEVMLLLVAEAARDLGLAVRVVGPRGPGGLVAAAVEAGHDTVVLDAEGRRSYMRALRSWDRTERTGLLWCNGLVPATATTGHRSRVVHLHQPPAGLQRLARVVATLRTEAVVVPSRWMADQVPHTVYLPNWTVDLDYLGPRAQPGSRIGFLGRLTLEKGVDVLGHAVAELERRGLGTTLVLAGEQRFGSDRDARLVGSALAPLEQCTERLGWVAPQDLFGQVDLAAFPSVWPEPFGLVAAEAMATGVPFVVTDSGALPEVVGPDHPWIARRGSVDDLADLLEQALSTSVPEREALALRLRARWEQEYSPSAGRRRLAGLLQDLGLAVA